MENLTGWWCSSTNVAFVWQAADRPSSAEAPVRQQELITEVKPAVSGADGFEWHSKRLARLCSSLNFLLCLTLPIFLFLSLPQTPCLSAHLWFCEKAPTSFLEDIQSTTDLQPSPASWSKWTDDIATSWNCCHKDSEEEVDWCQTVPQKSLRQREVSCLRYALTPQWWR